jgi:ankyrin repeat protein
MPPSEGQPAAQPSRRIRFDLRHLFVFVSLACAVFAIWSAWDRWQERKLLRQQFWRGIDGEDKELYQDAVRKDPSLVNARLDYYGASWDMDFDVPALRLAARNRDVEAVRFLLEHGADVNSLDRRRNAAIHRAATNPDTAILDLLIRHGADVDLPNEDGDSPLLLCGVFGNPRGAELLIAQGAKIDLHSACAIGDLATISRLLAADPSAAGSRGSAGRTPLACAVLGNHVHVTGHLLENGADPNQTASAHSDGTIMHIAAACGHTDIAQLLVDHGACVDRSLFGWQTPLRDAIDRQHWKTVNVLIAAGANVNPADSNPSPLHLAAMAGEAETVRLLLSHGAKIDVTHNFVMGQPETPLQVAVRTGQAEIVAMLQAAGTP